MGLGIQPAEISFLCRVAGLSLRDRVKSLDMWRELMIEPLLLHVERSQLRWFRHLNKMPPGCLPSEVFCACPTNRRPWGRPRTRFYILHLSWERLGISQEELENVAVEKDVWQLRKSIEEDLWRWNNLPISLIGRIAAIKMTLLPKINS